MPHFRHLLCQERFDFRDVSRCFPGVLTIRREFEIALEIGQRITAITFPRGIVQDAALVVGIGVVGVKLDGVVVIRQYAIPFVQQNDDLPAQNVEFGVIGV